MKYVLGVLGVMLVAVLAIVLITSSRGGNTNKQEGDRQIVVSEEARPDTSVVFTTQGRVVGQDERRAIRITVSQEERRLEILEGYEEGVQRAFVFPNTETAYENFMIALDSAGYSRERETTFEDERSVCPFGRRYIYELREHTQPLIRLWSTTCGSNQGTFGGARSTVRRLFQRQIPDYNSRVNNVRL